ncbi:Protein of unknown function [Cotesia congregata]|uniref:Uncharacterized protein n=1 Tax=Cotesia congregata TaxID=51543 RepID=A0A8J2HP05_COTCN|nr:Protein of unknown function [Cotesia congregata]
MGTLSEATGGAGGNPNNPGAKDQNIYENRAGTKKLIRVVTVIAYLFSSVNTIKLRNPIIEKIYHESDKVTTTSDLQTSIYDIINKHLDPSNDDKKTTDKSTVFTKIENTTETTVLLTPSTEMNKYYEKDENNFTSTSTSTPTPTTKIEFLNKIFDKNRQPPENNQLNTEITTDESNYQTTENLYFQGKKKIYLEILI